MTSPAPRQRDQFLVPSCFTNVLPPETVQLLECPNPKALLRKRISKLAEAIPISDSHGKYQIPNLSLSEDVQNFVPSQCDAEEVMNDSLSSRVCDALGVNDDRASTDGSMRHDAEWAGMLALFGWSPVTSSGAPDASEPPTLTVECVVCLARAKLTLETPTGDAQAAQSSPRRVLEKSIGSQGDDEEQSPPSKKQRIGNTEKETGVMNPETCHRHYCPYACGFHVGAPSKPVWQVIVCNLFQKETPGDKAQDAPSNIGEEAFRSVRQILRSGIAKSKPL